jgi:hypothetical protein
MLLQTREVRVAVLWLVEATVTFDDRQRIKAAVDAHKRDELAEAPRLGRMGCAGCGAHRDNNTIGCKRCWERHRQRARWKDPGYRKRWNAARTTRGKA